MELFLDQLAFFSGGYPRYPGSSVNPEMMRQILNDISQGKNNSASLGIEEFGVATRRHSSNTMRCTARLPAEGSEL